MRISEKNNNGFYKSFNKYLISTNTIVPIKINYYFTKKIDAPVMQARLYDINLHININKLTDFFDSHGNLQSCIAAKKKRMLKTASISDIAQSRTIIQKNPRSQTGGDINWQTSVVNSMIDIFDENHKKSLSHKIRNKYMPSSKTSSSPSSSIPSTAALKEATAIKKATEKKLQSEIMLDNIDLHMDCLDYFEFIYDLGDNNTIVITFKYDHISDCSILVTPIVGVTFVKKYDSNKLHVNTDEDIFINLEQKLKHSDVYSRDIMILLDLFSFKSISEKWSNKNTREIFSINKYNDAKAAYDAKPLYNTYIFIEQTLSKLLDFNTEKSDAALNFLAAVEVNVREDRDFNVFLEFEMGKILNTLCVCADKKSKNRTVFLVLFKNLLRDNNISIQNKKHLTDTNLISELTGQRVYYIKLHGYYHLSAICDHTAYFTTEMISKIFLSIGTKTKMDIINKVCSNNAVQLLNDKTPTCYSFSKCAIDETYTFDNCTFNRNTFLTEQLLRIAPSIIMPTHGTFLIGKETALLLNNDEIKELDNDIVVVLYEASSAKSKSDIRLMSLYELIGLDSPMPMNFNAIFQAFYCEIINKIHAKNWVIMNIRPKNIIVRINKKTNTILNMYLKDFSYAHKTTKATGEHNALKIYKFIQYFVNITIDDDPDSGDIIAAQEETETAARARAKTIFRLKTGLKNIFVAKVNQTYKSFYDLVDKMPNLLIFLFKLKKNNVNRDFISFVINNKPDIFYFMDMFSLTIIYKILKARYADAFDYNQRTYNITGNIHKKYFELLDEINELYTDLDKDIAKMFTPDDINILVEPIIVPDAFEGPIAAAGSAAAIKTYIPLASLAFAGVSGKAGQLVDGKIPQQQLQKPQQQLQKPQQQLQKPQQQLQKPQSSTQKTPLLNKKTLRPQSLNVKPMTIAKENSLNFGQDYSEQMS